MWTLLFGVKSTRNLYVYQQAGVTMSKYVLKQNSNSVHNAKISIGVYSWSCEKEYFSVCKNTNILQNEKEDDNNTKFKVTFSWQKPSMKYLKNNTTWHLSQCFKRSSSSALLTKALYYFISLNFLIF